MEPAYFAAIKRACASTLIAVESPLGWECRIHSPSGPFSEPGPKDLLDAAVEADSFAGIATTMPARIVGHRSTAPAACIQNIEL